MLVPINIGGDKEDVWGSGQQSQAIVWLKNALEVGNLPSRKVELTATIPAVIVGGLGSIGRPLSKECVWGDGQWCPVGTG